MRKQYSIADEKSFSRACESFSDVCKLCSNTGLLFPECWIVLLATVEQTVSQSSR